LVEQLEFEDALGLLLPMHDATGVPTALTVEAALLESSAYIALQQQAAAVAACRRGIVAANYDPEIAREQAPRVQAACRIAAAEARTALVEERRIAIGDVQVTSARVAWNPIRITAQIRGNVTNLVTEAEVRINDNSAFTVVLRDAGGGIRSGSIDANLGVPGGRIQVVPLVRDEFGILVRSETPTTYIVPEDEAAVRFNAGSDEGPLEVDGRSTRARVRVGDVVPLPLGSHVLEVRTPRGRSHAAINLRRGEIALLTLHSEAGSNALDIARWSSTVGAVALLGAGGVFYFLAASAGNQLAGYAETARDPQTGLPLIQWSDVAPIDETRATNQNIAIGLFAGGAALAVVAIVTWAIPHPNSRRESRRTNAFELRPGLSGLAITF
jgi:hypothetical protein